MMNNIFESWLVKSPIAHRGLHDKTSPENSVSAFEKAVKKGFAIELDVQVTKDGVPVVFHDDLLDRMTDGTGDIREKSFNQICDLTLKNSQEKIPLFSEVLKIVDGNVPLLIEVKNHKDIGDAEKKITQVLQDYHGEFAIQSFNPLIIKWFKNNTSFYAGILSSFFKDINLSLYKKILLKNLWLINNVKSDFVSYECTAGYSFNKLKKLKNKMPILFWTVHSQQDADKYLQICDNIIFEGFIPQ